MPASCNLERQTRIFQTSRIFANSTNRFAQCGDGVSRGEADGKFVVLSATDDCGVVGIFPDPDYAIGVHKDFHAIYVFKHDKFHIALL